MTRRGMPTRSASDLAVPLLDLTAQFRPIRDDVLNAIARVCDTQRFILGAEVEALERELAARMGAAHAVAVSSGTDALLVALMALGVGPGAEVITPTYSFFATAGSVARVGATPVFVDIDPETFNAAPAAIEQAITIRTRAILPVHLFGLCADMDPILAVGRAAGVPVIEDAAQAIDARDHGRAAGTMGRVGCFSFFPTKNLGAFGDGGLLTTDDEALAADLRLLRNHGAETKYVHSRVGGNFRLDAIQAAVLRVKLPHLDHWTEARRRNALRYGALFEEFGLSRTIVLPTEPAGWRHIYNQFVICAPRRDDLRAHLTTRSIHTEIYYPIPFHRQVCFATVPSAGGRFPHADCAATRSLALPIYGELTEDQQRHVVASIAEFYAGQA